MKTLIIAAAVIAAGATGAAAQYGPWARGAHPYEQRHHNVCQEKAHRLHDYERRALRDGRLSNGERQSIAVLQRDLDRTCGRYRYRG